MIIWNLSGDAATFSHSIELVERQNQSDNPLSERNTTMGGGGEVRNVEPLN